MLGFSPISATPIASSGEQISVSESGVGAFSSVSISPTLASATGGAGGVGALSFIAIAAPDGAASNDENANASGAFASMLILPFDGLATGGAAVSSGCRSILISSVTGSAYVAGLFARSPSGATYQRKFKNTARPKQINTTRH